MTEPTHPFVMLTVEPGSMKLSVTSSMGAETGLQLCYYWPLLDNPATQVMRYKIKALGLTKILKQLQHERPVAMTISGGKIYLQSTEFADLLGDYSAGKDGAKYWLEVVADEYSRNFEMLCINKALSVKLVAADLGRHLKIVEKYIDLSPQNYKQDLTLQLYFTPGQVSIQGQVLADFVAITQPWCSVRSQPEPFISSTIALACKLAVKVVSLLTRCAGEVAVTLLGNGLLIERPGWALWIKLATVTRDGQTLEKQLEAGFVDTGCELQTSILLNRLPRIAIADHVEKEELHLMTHNKTHPNLHDEFMLKMNQDHVGAALTIQTIHPLAPELDICCNLGSLQLVLNTLPMKSRWIFLSPQQALLFCDEAKTIRFVMACRPPRVNF
ncbi:hypothetical protein MD588_05435 [Photobacterium sp. SDRW27]|uniref:hypothetical protein n=1 Tax=Photobacterium obscurum TaxID=2829490 RepID=UPI002244BE40|nr:hypothetical protein [Photobacterium obscurum]MCW8328246.1 hypothetical protein [Photobacterium obscurum]